MEARKLCYFSKEWKRVFTSSCRRLKLNILILRFDILISSFKIRCQNVYLLILKHDAYWQRKVYFAFISQILISFENLNAYTQEWINQGNKKHKKNKIWLLYYFQELGFIQKRTKKRFENLKIVKKKNVYLRKLCVSFPLRRHQRKKTINFILQIIPFYSFFFKARKNVVTFRTLSSSY